MQFWLLGRPENHTGAALRPPMLSVAGCVRVAMRAKHGQSCLRRGAARQYCAWFADIALPPTVVGLAGRCRSCINQPEHHPRSVPECRRVSCRCCAPGHFFGGGFLKRYDNCSVLGTDLEIECHWSEHHRLQRQDGNVTDNADTADVLA